MASGDDETPVPLRPPLDPEARADVQWEILARREARIAEAVPEPASRIPRRVRWWVAAFFIIAVVIVFRDRIAEWLPGLGF